MNKIFNFVKELIKHYQRFGIYGLKFFMAKQASGEGLVAFSDANELPEPVYLRKHTSDIAIFNEIIFYRNYDFDKSLKPKVIVDCGGHIGLASVYFTNTFKQAKIYTFEPNRANYEVLLKNTANYKNVTPHNAGVWSKTTTLEIQESTSSNDSHVLKEGDGLGSYKVPVYSITDIMLNNNLQQIDILKIDIEGSEKELFEQDYEYWMDRTNLIIIELHDRMREGTAKAFFSTLVKYNFQMRHRGENIICYLKH